MAKGSSFIDDWIEEGEARGEARGKAEGEARGEARGKAKGEASEARRIAERILVRRFGELPESITSRIRTADREWCEELAIRASEVESLEELDWQQ